MHQYTSPFSLILMSGIMFNVVQTGSTAVGLDDVPRLSLREAKAMITQKNVELQTKGVIAILLDRMEHPEAMLNYISDSAVQVDERCITILLRLVTNEDDPGRRILKESGLDFFSYFNPGDESAHYFNFWNLFPAARGLLADRIRKLAADPDESRRKSATMALSLGILDLKQTRQILDKLSDDSSWEVRSEAAVVTIQLGHKGVFAADYVSAMLKRAVLRDTDERVRERVVDVLAKEFESECCSRLKLRSELVHSLVTLAKQDHAADEVLLGACARAALAANTSSEDALALIQLMMNREFLESDKGLMPEYISLLSCLSKNELSKITDNFSDVTPECRYDDYLRSLGQSAVKMAPDKDAVDCIVRTVCAGSKVDALGPVLRRHNPEVLGRIIRQVSAQHLTEAGSYSFGIVLANVSAGVAHREKDVFSRLVRSENVWIRTGAGIAMLSAGITEWRAGKILNEVLNDPKVDGRFRLMALDCLIANRQLKTVAGATLEQLMTAQEGLTHLGYCKEAILCTLIDAVGNGADFDDKVPTAILFALKHPDVSTCYRVRKAMLRSAKDSRPTR